MFKVGEKAKGFKFDGCTDGVHYDNAMDDHVGVVGEVTEVYSDSFAIMFPDHLEWMYPASLWNLAKVEETQPFKIGDRVKFKKSSVDTGMIDATEEDVFCVKGVHNEHWGVLATLEGYSYTVNITHLEHVEEEIMEDQKINWEVGQEVWCLIRGKGVVSAVHDNNSRTVGCLPVIVEFEYDKFFDYSYKGIGSGCTVKMFVGKRTLFFSEPIVTAELFPPKKPFVPTLKEGDGLMVINSHGKVECYGYVEQEFEDSVAMRTGDVYEKAYYNFFQLGEEIKFS